MHGGSGTSLLLHYQNDHVLAITTHYHVRQCIPVHSVAQHANPEHVTATEVVFISAPKYHLQSTDHELIPARNACLAAMKGSAIGSNVRFYAKFAPQRDETGLLTMLPNCPMFTVRL
jgi:hypothetical protein